MQGVYCCLRAACFSNPHPDPLPKGEGDIARKVKAMGGNSPGQAGCGKSWQNLIPCPEAIRPLDDSLPRCQLIAFYPAADAIARSVPRKESYDKVTGSYHKGTKSTKEFRKERIWFGPT